MELLIEAIELLLKVMEVLIDAIKQLVDVIEQMVKLSDNKLKLSIFGIVTTGSKWQFVRWTGSLEEPVIHISEPHTCDFGENMNNEIKVLTFRIFFCISVMS